MTQPDMFPKEISADDPRAAALVAACMAVDMTGAAEEVAAANWRPSGRTGPIWPTEDTPTP